MIEPSSGSFRKRPYDAYASQRAACNQGEADVLIYRRDIQPAPPPPTVGPVLDIGGTRVTL